MNIPDDKLTIQQVADATGLSVYTLRYYERIGLIHLIDRAENRHRRYSVHDLGWIEFLTKLRATGMSIQQMLSYAELQRKGDETLPQRLELLNAHRRQVEAHIQALSEDLKLICYKIEVYGDSLRETT
jgi:DNA-binding transcriptional MerR regulator